MTELEYRLGTAIYRLTEEQPEAVSAYGDDGRFLGIHTVTHAPLLDVLANGTGITRGARTSETRIPIDASAIELLASIMNTLRDWCRWMPFSYTRNDPIGSTKEWHDTHMRRLKDGQLSDEGERIAVETVESWVLAIENKFNGSDDSDITDPCPLCNARRIVINDEERFALYIDWRRQLAICYNCGAEWWGQKGTEERPGLHELRWMMNIAEERRNNHDTPNESEMRTPA
jgi:hypothetical protein